MNIVGIIPARGGSQRIKNKNLRTFAGKPLIAWAILTAKKGGLDRVLVSTDDPIIARVAKKYGVEVIDRPAKLAIATIGIEPTLKHAYQWLLDRGYRADGLAMMMATNPLRQPFHIREAVALFQQKKVDSVVSVNETPANHTPYWTLIRPKNGKVTLWGGVSLTKILTRRQDFPQKCYARNDIIYVLKPENLLEKKPNLYGKRVELYDTDTSYESDINTPEEWSDAEVKFKRLRQNR